ncbi:MAG: alpha/beta hydrolase [Chlamydiales bacterium]
MIAAYQIALGLLGVIIVLIIFQVTATMIDNYRYPPVGRLVNVGTHQLHIHTTGRGSPSVILDAGLSGTSLGWSLVQPKISEFTQVCSYDRAGYAWSDESPSKRTTDNIVEELRALLKKADVPGPYILVGHSFGGCNVLLFAHRYPEEVVGVVLVDSVHEDMFKNMPELHQNLFDKITSSSTVQWFLSVLGYKRLRGPSKEIQEMFKPLPAQVRHAYLAQMFKTSYTNTVSREMDGLEESLCQLDESKLMLKDIPLVVISAGKFSDEGEGRVWDELQKKLLLKSNHSKRIIAENSDHMINHHQPEVIVDAIREIFYSYQALL